MLKASCCFLVLQGVELDAVPLSHIDLYELSMQILILRFGLWSLASVEEGMSVRDCTLFHKSTKISKEIS